MDIVGRLREACLDKDNMPRMDSERWFPVGLAREATAEIDRLRSERLAFATESEERKAYNERLRAALKQMVEDSDLYSGSQLNSTLAQARAALKETKP